MVVIGGMINVRKFPVRSVRNIYNFSRTRRNALFLGRKAILLGFSALNCPKKALSNDF